MTRECPVGWEEPAGRSVPLEATDLLDQLTASEPGVALETVRAGR
jgi:hypothetical protein